MREIIENRFALTYYTNLTKEDVDNMTKFEMDNWIQLLIERKDEERKAKEI